MTIRSHELAGADVAMSDLTARAEAWLADDPDEGDRAELRAVLDALPGSADELADRFAGPLTFGTAGLRGPLRAGPAGMNLAVVRAAAAGLVRWLDARGVAGPVVIGYDARHRSEEFARETARVATGAGRRALVLPRTLPTPVLAHAVRALNAAAGVMVTASHNPPQDNGYKVYLGEAAGGPGGDGAQLVPPFDAEIEAAIRDVGPLTDVPLGEPGALLGEELISSYVDGAAAVVDPRHPRDLVVAYTAMHGVGTAVFLDALAAAGFSPPLLVASQAEPDPTFPTVAFPNPEEPGAMDRAVALARSRGADIVIANDPDADRCAVAVPDPTGPAGWRTLRGDEVGVLLADHLMRRGVRGRYATTIVSSSLLSKLCQERGLPYGETLTGFKWIVRAGRGVAGRSVGGSAPLVYGYEEALGYCVAPEHVRDKDGISAALLVCELAAGLKAAGATLLDRLDELAARFGVYATDQLSARFVDLTGIGAAMDRVRARPPATLVGQPVTAVDDMLPVTDAVILRTGSARVVIRPSGTEPKLKAYLEVVEPVADGDVPTARTVRRPRCRDCGPRRPPHSACDSVGEVAGHHFPDAVTPQANTPSTQDCQARSAVAWSTFSPKWCTAMPTGAPNASRPKKRYMASSERRPMKYSVAVVDDGVDALPRPAASPAPCRPRRRRPRARAAAGTMSRTGLRGRRRARGRDVGRPAGRGSAAGTARGCAGRSRCACWPRRTGCPSRRRRSAVDVPDPGPAAVALLDQVVDLVEPAAVVALDAARETVRWIPGGDGAAERGRCRRRAARTPSATASRRCRW